MPEFQGFPKIPRLNRDIIITEKIDGTNAAVGVTEDGDVYAQSRTRIIIPEQDNFGFAQWVYDNSIELGQTLGVGLHFGEWWGSGINRAYGYKKGERFFSLFNVDRYADAPESGLWRSVPVLYHGPFNNDEYGIAQWDHAIERLIKHGSYAAPGFMNPEGIVIFHAAARQSFKVTILNDAQPKGR